jgi:hypothetical protein
VAGDTLAFLHMEREAHGVYGCAFVAVLSLRHHIDFRSRLAGQGTWGGIISTLGVGWQGKARGEAVHDSLVQLAEMWRD